MKQRVVLSGYYGLGNAGDEAVLAATVEMFRSARPGFPLAVLSGDPEATRRELDVDAVPRMSPGALLPLLRSCGLFLSGGGSLLQDRTSLKSLLYYLSLLWLARRAGARTMVFAQGVGPLSRPAARRLTARVLRGVDRITLRDSESAELLGEIGIRGEGAPPVEVTADPVFALQPRVTENVWKHSGERPVIALALRPWPEAEQLPERLAEALKPLAEETRFQAWPLFPHQDLSVARRLASLLPGTALVEEPLAPGEWMALAGWMDGVIAMRLHGLIFGAARGARVAGISYDPKVDALLLRLRAPCLGSPGALRAESVVAVADEMIHAADAGRTDREARAAHLAGLARRNVELALDVYDGR